MGWNHYPEVQIQGIYSLSNTQQTRSKIRFGIYRLMTNSSTAAVLGALPLGFTAINLGKKFLAFLSCPAALCGLYPYFPSFIKNLAYSDFIENLNCIPPYLAFIPRKVKSQLFIKNKFCSNQNSFSLSNLLY